MKKYFLIPLVVIAALMLSSWGSVGHHAVAAIAENHLTPQAKSAVKAILGNESLADVSTWADEVRNTPAMKYSTSWHYINAPLGLSYDEFAKTIKGQEVGNVYNAILKCERELMNPNSTKDQKAEALKFIVHFVGDSHQPFHVSRAEDKGGNTIQVQFDGKGTNMHSVWDSKLIDHQGLTFEQMVKEYDTATPAEIKQWQSDDMMKWMYESYEIATKLYSEAEADNKLDEKYYNEHIPIVKQRIEMAGIRLAGVLNQIFSDGAQSSASASQHQSQSNSDTIPSNPTYVEIKDVNKHIGEYVTVYGQIYGYKDLGEMVLVNLGAAYPNQLLTAVLKGKAIEKAKAMFLTKDYLSPSKNPDITKMLAVNGKLILYKGKPEIVVTEDRFVNGVVSSMIREPWGDNKSN
jgi:hypothetical protein